MNQLLFDRSLGTLGPRAFARFQTSERIHTVQQTNLRFNGVEKEALPIDDDGKLKRQVPITWAHRAGVNALAIDIENRMYGLSIIT